MTDIEENKIKCKGGGSIINQAPVFSPDGQCLYIPWKNFIRSYNVKTGERISDFEGCENNIIGARIHPTNSALLVGCSVTGEIAIWKWETRLLISVHKIKFDIDKVTSFHLVCMNKELNDCDILLCWVYQNKNHLGLFSLKKLEYKSAANIVVPNHFKAVAIGCLEKIPFVAAIYSNNLVCARIDGKYKVHTKSASSKFTCIACHPEKYCVATGDDAGRITVWRDLFTKGQPVKAIYHWHTLPVNTLAFSETGSILYSGGNECVIVKWNLDNLNKTFLPRLPAPIMHLSNAPGNICMAISTKDNAIHITNSHFKPKSIIQHLTWTVSSLAGIHVDFRTKSLVMNGHVGNIQFYSPHTMTLLYNLDIVGQNKLTDERNTKIPNTNISKVALTKLGDWLACVEDRIDNEIYQEIRLKFFKYDETNRLYTLNTSVEYPHENGVNDIEFQPPCNSTDLLCATTGNDNLFKIWSLVDTSDIYHKSRAWRCWSSASYKSFPCSSLSFSSDGSLLVVAFGPCLTAWTPDTCEIKCSLIHPSFRSPLKKVRCGNVDQCHLVVAASSDRLCVWNLLTLALLWTVPVKVAQLCADPLSIYMAVITQEDGLFIFSPSSSSPVFHRKKITSDNNKVVAAAFVPRITENITDVVWQRLSQLYYINTNQELLYLETSDDSGENSILEYIPQTQKTAYGALVAETVVSTTKEQDKIFHLGKGLSGATDIKQLLEPPVHTMAPMRLLCNSVLRSFIIKERELSEFVPGENDEKSDNSDEKNEEDSDSNSEKIISKRKTIPKPQTKSKKQKNKQNLEFVLSESCKWTKILID